ncbi:cation:proton antiporter [Gemmatimonas sp.]|uniref:cation:proton antiporter n=1 Tax=Gemmatimonas sp. TaxID=1962908 RepID=UPI0025BE33E0|nr:cation:proton antiporter [Gemmatimonas sp.]MCA2991617.1 cation:proton antiporter [Gemmatimonas sp.]
MVNAHAFLANLTLVLCVAALTTVVFQRIRQPVVFGYLVAGMIIGPYVGVPLFADRSMVTTLSELGVILLMFGLGLEFSLRKLAAVAPTVGLIALVDTSAMFGFGYVTGQLLGWTPLESVFGGAIVAISSTTIIVKAFAEQGVKGRFTELVYGILIIEDLIAILLIAMLTTIASGAGLSAGAVAATAGTLVLFLALFIGVGLAVVPRLVRMVVALDRPETTLVVSLGLCFGGALLALDAGYSVALGAFIAGSLVAESGEGSRVEHLVMGVRDMFGAVFFVAVGMMIDPRLVAEHWVAVVVLSLVVMTGKLLAVSVGAFLSGNDVRTSTQAGMSLTQIGEFAFIIAAVGTTAGVVGAFLYPVAVAVSAITTLTTPIAIRASGAVATFVDRRLPRPLQTFVGLYGTWIASLRRTPAAAATAPLVRRKIRLLVLDTALLTGVVIGTVFAKPRLLAEFAARSLPPLWASAALYTIAVLLAAPLVVGIVRVAGALSSLLAFRALPQSVANRLDYAESPRRVLMATLQLALVTVSGLVVVVVTEPFVPLGRGAAVLAVVVGWLTVVFWRRTADLYGHTRAGAQVLLSALSKGFASASPAAATAATPNAAPRDLSTVHRVLPGLGDPVPYVVRDGDASVGRTLRELQLRSQTGAVILAITRGTEQVLLPVGSERLQAGDVLALAGTTESIADATSLLQRAEHT